MANSAALFLTPNKLGGLEEPKMTLTEADLAQLRSSGGSAQAETPWAKTTEGQATLEGAKQGASTGSLGNTLTSAGLYNMLGAGAFTPVGGALAAGGIVLNAIDQGNAVDYNNRKMVADQQKQAHDNKVAGLYRMLGKNYGIS